MIVKFLDVTILGSKMDANLVVRTLNGKFILVTNIIKQEGSLEILN